MLRKVSSTCAFAALALVMATPAFASSGSVAIQTNSSYVLSTDEAVANEIGRRIAQYAFYSIYDDVDGWVHDGVVTLTGKVRMPHIASDIAKLAAQVAGVREVDNRIQTLPVSMFDDELRAGIAAQIYGDPLFSNYAFQSTPPIHIVVENGHVRLTGVVNSEVERRMADVIARMTPGTFDVDNNLRLDSEMTSAN